MDTMEYLRIIWRRKWLILAVVVIMAGLSILRSQRTVPVYEAAAKVVARSRGASTSYGPNQSSQLNAYDYAEILKSRPMLERIAASLGKPADLSLIRASISANVSNLSNVLDLRFRSTDPDEALAGVKEMVACLQEYSLSYQHSRIDKAVEVLRTTLAEEKKKPQRPLAGGGPTLVEQLERDLNVQLISRTLCDGEIEVVESPLYLGNSRAKRTFFDFSIAVFWGAVLGTGLAFLLEHMRMKPQPEPKQGCA